MFVPLIWTSVPFSFNLIISQVSNYGFVWLPYNVMRWLQPDLIWWIDTRIHTTFPYQWIPAPVSGTGQASLEWPEWEANIAQVEVDGVKRGIEIATPSRLRHEWSRNDKGGNGFFPFTWFRVRTTLRVPDASFRWNDYLGEGWIELSPAIYGRFRPPPGNGQGNFYPVSKLQVSK